MLLGNIVAALFPRFPRLARNASSAPDEIKGLASTLIKLVDEQMQDRRTNQALVDLRNQLEIVLVRANAVACSSAAENGALFEMPNETWLRGERPQSRFAARLRSTAQSKGRPDKPEPAAVAVAKRLLAEGKDPLTVSRKVLLPIAEITKLAEKVTLVRNDSPAAKKSFAQVIKRRTFDGLFERECVML